MARRSSKSARVDDKRRKRTLYISEDDTIAWMWSRQKGMKGNYAVQDKSKLYEHEPNRHGLGVRDVVCGAPGMKVGSIVLDCYLAVNIRTGVMMARFPGYVYWFVSNRLEREVREQIYDRVEMHVEAHVRENIERYRRIAKDIKERS